MRALFVLGRAIFGGYFVYNGINHIRNRPMLAGYAASKGVPSPDAAVLGSGSMLLAGGSSIISGVNPKLGLALIIGFLIPTSLKMHGFWEIDDPQQQMPEMVNFMKNMALVGAALMMMQIPEPWPVRIGGGEEEDDYLMLGSREWRALSA